MVHAVSLNRGRRHFACPALLAFEAARFDVRAYTPIVSIDVPTNVGKFPNY